MKKKLKWLALVVVAGFVVIQFANPARTNPPVVKDISANTAVPNDVTALLHAACYDCHSYETKWPWYSHVAPASWLVIHDVNEGRDNFNFSDWPDDPAWIAKRLKHIHEEIDSHEMPPAKYTMMHPEARLTEAQRKAIMDWTDTLANQLRSSSTNQ
jgi:hypothetical protein